MIRLRCPFGTTAGYRTLAARHKAVYPRLFGPSRSLSTGYPQTLGLGGVDKGIWAKSPPDLIERFDAGVAPFLSEPGVERRQMFGYPACFVGGNMFTSLHQDRWVVRLGEADRASLTELGGGRFEVMPGREMRGYLVLPAELSQPDAARPWVERALAFARSLPAKQKKR